MDEYVDKYTDQIHGSKAFLAITGVSRKRSRYMLIHADKILQHYQPPVIPNSFFEDSYPWWNTIMLVRLLVAR